MFVIVVLPLPFGVCDRGTEETAWLAAHERTSASFREQQRQRPHRLNHSIARALPVIFVVPVLDSLFLTSSTSHQSVTMSSSGVNVRAPRVPTSFRSMLGR